MDSRLCRSFEFYDKLLAGGGNEDSEQDSSGGSLERFRSTSATEIDDLVNTSQSIRDTFAYGIKTIAGGAATLEMAQLHRKWLKTDRLLLNNRMPITRLYQQLWRLHTHTTLAQRSTFLHQADQAMDQVSEMIDAYVQAAQTIIMVATVNEMAQDAQTAEDERQAMALQEFMGANDVTLQDEEIEAYNDALSNTEQAIQVAAAYMAVVNDEGLLEQANDMAFDLRVTYEEATLCFDLETTAVWVSFDGGESIQGLR